jgi:uncharacterized BrkB/YihY/UPF0761 family membrane protein
VSDEPPPTDGLPPDAQLSTRLDRWRARADAAADRYQERAQTQPLLGLPLAFLARYTARQGILLASAIAFRLFLWLLPLALLAAGILAALAAGDLDAVSSVNRSAGVTGAASEEVTSALRDGHRSWWVAIVIGAVLLVWTTRTLLRSLTVVNAHLWGVPSVKRRQKELLLTAALFAGGWFAVLAATSLLWRLHELGPIGTLLALIGQVVLVGGAWMFISTRLPDGRQDLVDLLPGCILFGAGLTVLNLVSRVYLPARFSSSSQLYGSLGVAGVILAWLLIVGQLVVASALANVVWAEYRASRRTRA